MMSVWEAQINVHLVIPKMKIGHQGAEKLANVRHLQLDVFAPVRPPAMHTPAPEETQLLDTISQLRQLQTLGIHTAPDSPMAFLSSAFGYQSMLPGSLKNLTRLALWVSCPNRTVLMCDIVDLSRGIARTCPKLTHLRLPVVVFTPNNTVKDIFDELSNLSQLVELSVPTALPSSDWSALRKLDKLRRLDIGGHIPGIPLPVDVDHWTQCKLAFVPVYFQGLPILNSVMSRDPSRLLDLYHSENSISREFLVDFLKEAFERNTVSPSLLRHPAIVAAAERKCSVDVDLRFLQAIPWVQARIGHQQILSDFVQVFFKPYFSSETGSVALNSIPVKLVREIKRSCADLSLVMSPLGPGPFLFQAICAAVPGLLSNAEQFSVYCDNCWLKETADLLHHAENRNPLIKLEEGSHFRQPLVSLGRAKTDEARVRL
jgi:hypothetical protein